SAKNQSNRFLIQALREDMCRKAKSVLVSGILPLVMITFVPLLLNRTGIEVAGFPISVFWIFSCFILVPGCMWTGWVLFEQEK
ncbi:hypothetical protein, partial [Komagataeibacter europaeus]